MAPDDSPIDWSTAGEDEIIDAFVNVTVWKAGGQRAPHKPLLLLHTLARAKNGENRLQAFEALELELRELLVEFGARRKSHHPAARVLA